jgi:hypothetical protein
MEDANLSHGHLLANEVYVDLDMLGATVVDRISSHVDGANIVAEAAAPSGTRRRHAAVKILVWFWRIDETLCANLFDQV